MVCSLRALLSRGLVLHSMEDFWGLGSIHLLGKEPGDLERSDLYYRQGGSQNAAWHVFSVDWSAGPKEPVKSRVTVGVGCR